ncbi:MAG: ABC transporter ATP-binding protein [Dehalococcoidales bacterium]
MVLLSVKDLRVFYKKAEAVKGVSFIVDEGTLVSIIGANGAGKTTILKTLSGLLRATSGEISFDGKRIEKTPVDRIVKMGIAQVPAGRKLFPQLSVMENLSAGAYTIKNHSEVNSLLEDVFKHFPRLKERINQRAGSLSGGEQQMLAIGRALMCRPRLLVMDEPSLGLSPIMVQEIGSIIKTMKEAGKTILLVEQNANLALKLADRTYVLELGKVVLEGKSVDIMNNPIVKKAYLGAT